MALKIELETLEGLDEGIAGLYVEKDGKFVLDVDGHEKNDDTNKIPISRLNQEIEKRKASEQTLDDIASGFVEAVPEDMRDIIPDLPPAAKIKWIQNAEKKGLFTPKGAKPIDAKRPGAKPSENFEGMSPQAIMAQGYKTK